jgi:beta-galactosidase
MYYGAAYYPEHWPEERWATDAKLMRDAGFNVVRLGEFAWTRVEPAEDNFDFAWLDRAIAILAGQGIKVLIGTPTAGPPAWLVNAETPETECRQLYEDGVRPEFGARSLCCLAHPRFLDRSERVASALGAHFANNPAVIGFQIDNELGMYGHRCYCASCHAQFRNWLKDKYGTVLELNSRLGMIFGSGEFRTFADVPIPRIRQDLHNPGLLLDSWRFFSEVSAKYIGVQADAIRGTGANQPITTNVCHMFHGGGALNEDCLFEPLDIVGWDCYPAQFGTPPRSSTVGMLHAIARGFKTRNGRGNRYWMLEQQSGSPMSAAAGDLRQIRLWAWQSVSHGADMILYFRWRTCRFGGEQYWRGILDHEGEVNQRYQIVSRTGHDMATLAPVLANLERQTDAAIFLDYESLSSIHLSTPGPGFDVRASAEKFYAAIVGSGRVCDVLFDAADLGRYKLIVAPLLRLMDETLASSLIEFVASGGTLIVTALTASLDRDHVAPDIRPPWLLKDLLGVEQIEWSSLAQSTKPPKERLGEASENWQHLNSVGQAPVQAEPDGPLNGIYVCETWCDHLKVLDASVLARFCPGSPAAGLPALTGRRYGSGRGYYVAGQMDERFHQDLIGHLLPNVSPITGSKSKDVEIVGASLSGKPVHFVLNHEPEAHTVSLTGEWHDLLTNAVYKDEFELEAYGVSILKAVP